MEPLEPPPEAFGQREVDAAAAVARRVQDNIRKAVKVRDDVLDDVLIAFLAEGHILVEDYPGVGKTALARALSRSIDCQFARVQCTADLLPADILGTNVFNQRESRFEFRPGPIFANIVVVDEVNRASPKTQSAMLECMEERQVTIDGHTYRLDEPFMVIATQNPIEMEGTYPLPEAQRDRFMARVSMGYPVEAAELAMLDHHAGADPLANLAAVTDASEVAKLIDVVRQVFVSPAVRRYAVDLVSATRRTPDLRLGASPRATLHLVRAAKAAAALDRREYVIPDDLQRLAPAVLGHRLLLSADAVIGGRRAEQVLAAIVASVPVPHTGHPTSSGSRGQG